MKTDDDLRGEIERLRTGQREFSRAHRETVEDVAAAIETQHAQARATLTGRMDGAALDGFRLRPNDKAQLLLLCLEVGAEYRAECQAAFERIDKSVFSPLSSKERQARLDAYDQKIAKLERELVERERQRRHEAVDAEYAS